MKDLARRTASDKFIRHKAFNVEKNPPYDGYKCYMIGINVLDFLIKSLVKLVLLCIVM